MKNFAFSIVFLFTFLLISCGEKGPDAVPMEGSETYTDQATKFSINYPKNWTSASVTGSQFQAVSDDAGKSRFVSYDGKGLPVGRISVTQIVAKDSLFTVARALDTARGFKPEVYTAPVDVTIDGTKAKKTTYSFMLNDGSFDGEMYAMTKDNVLYTIVKFEAFGGAFESYKDGFADILKSIKIGEKPASRENVVGEVTEADPPSKTMKTVQGNGYTISIPDNFAEEKQSGRVLYIGERRGDSYVSVTVTPTESTNIEGTAKNTAKQLKAEATKTKISGIDAYLISYVPSKKIFRDMYYVIKEGKLYQIVVDYTSNPEEKDLYKEVLTKSAKSIKFK